MKKIFLLIFTLMLTHFVLNAADGKKYGKEITLKEKTKISKIMENPESFVGKKVLVEGNVVDVCEKRGCWMDISSDKEFEKIKIKVDDGEIVFPMEAKGKKALVEGEVYAIVTESENCSGDCKSEGEKTEKCEHEKTVKKIYQIKGLGAVID
jgi:hypothetical protein